MARISDEKIDLAFKQAVDLIRPDDIGPKITLKVNVDQAISKITKSIAEKLGVSQDVVINSMLYEVTQFRYFDAYLRLKEKYTKK